jgi:secreted trypsin-like serine protease
VNVLNNLKYIFALVVCLFVVACAPSKQNGEYDTHQVDQIIGGQDLSLSSILNRSVVMILNQNNVGSASICTGTFISPTIILTAAHCVSDNKNDLVIQMGNSIFSDQEMISFNVLAVEKHENYQKTENDLALIRVEENKTVSVIPVALAKDKDLSNKKMMTLLGYGVNQIEESEDEFQGAGHLRSLNVQSSRMKLNQFTFSIDQSVGSGACHGDSGGPAFLMLQNRQYVLAGVASGVVQSDDEADCTNQSVYTSVSSYKSWILKSIEELMMK